MRFSDSPTVSLPIGNTTLTFSEDNTTLHVGTSIWPCSLVLVKFIDRWLLHPHPNKYTSLLHFPSKRAIELGSGCGPAGLALTLLHLDILLTDIPPVFPALKFNIKRNRPRLPRTPKHKVLYWNNKAHIAAVNPPFDYVVAADVVYMEDSAVQLVAAMEELVADDGVVLLGYQVRCKDADRVFWEMCRRTFPVIEMVPREDLHPEYAFPEADVYLMRKRKVGVA